MDGLADNGMDGFSGSPASRSNSFLCSTIARSLKGLAFAQPSIVNSGLS